MYFEDIYNKIAPLWKQEFSLDGIEETETYIEDISNEWNRLDNELRKSNYSWWEFSMLYAIYQVLSDFGEKKYKKEKIDSLTFDEVPVALFEKKFRENMEPEDEFEGNEEYLSRYKGFKNPPSLGM